LLKNPSKSTLAHDAVAAAVLHKHHPIIPIGAGLIQFVYDLRSRLANRGGVLMEEEREERVEAAEEGRYASRFGSAGGLAAGSWFKCRADRLEPREGRA